MNRLGRKLRNYSLLLCMSFIVMAFNPLQVSSQDSDDVNINISQVDKSQFPSVTVYISITDSDGEPVGVDPYGIKLEENGEVIDPDLINGSGEVTTLTTMLVIDVSGSMNSGGKLEAAKAAAQAYIEQMRPGDKAGLLVFNTGIEIVQKVTKNREALIAAVRNLRASKDTSMYDALVVAVENLDLLEGRKAIIVLTDGLDNRSTATPEEVIQKIGPSGLSISTIGLGDPSHGKGAQTALDEHALIALAGDAGGVYGYAEDEDALLDIYERYGRALQAEYSLTYTSPATIRDGINRSLSVSLESTVAHAGVGQYNPGGLIPETAAPTSWSLFYTLLGVLVLLLFVPFIIRGLISIFEKGKDTNSGKIKMNSRIKLKD